MLAAMVLVALVASGPALPSPAPTAVRVVPGEPGAVMLPDAEPTYQAVVADLDGDAARELVRLVGGERGSISAETWTLRGSTWEPMAPAVEVVPSRPTAGQGDVVYAGAPVRLLVRQVDGRDRVTVVRQPRYEDTGAEGECCLLLHDLLLDGGSIRLRAVADPSDAMGAVSVIDLDGDGTDELLASRSLPPLGDIGFPSEARVFRWTGDSFGAPTVTALPVGSGDSPFVLGDSDGRPGEEAAIISTIGRPALYRLSLAEGDTLRLEDAGLVATDALAVPLGDGRGLAVLGPTTDLAVMPWPAGEPPAEPIAQLPFDEGALLGVVELLDQPHLIVRQTDPEALHSLTLPDLGPSRGNPVTRSPAAAAFAASPLAPYIGPLPGGGLDGEPAVIYAGRLLPSEDLPDAPFQTLDTAPMATLAGAEPVGLAGPDRSWLAIFHAPLPLGRLDPSGGRLDGPVFQPGSGVSLAPVDVSRAPERDDASYEPTFDLAIPLAGGELGIAETGFIVTVDAPPGSRVYVAEADPSVVGTVVTVGQRGLAAVRVLPPSGPPEPSFRASLTVTTPAGHAYVASWDVRVLSEAPPLDARTSTPFGSAEVEVTGRTVPYAEVIVAGRPVAVAADGAFATTVAAPPWPTRIPIVARDPLGNVADMTLSGVGLFDYRGLPWVPISVVLVGVAAILLFLRVPRAAPVPRTADDAVLEEMDPD